MGLFVSLYAQTDNIPPQQWSDVFDESLELLMAYPLPLVGLRWDDTVHGRRAMFVPVGLRQDEMYGKHWRIEGDAVSGNHGETFLLQREMPPLNNMNDDGEVDVLWQNQDLLGYFNGHGSTIFHSKTQEYPFHYAMLAVGMLFESRFPGKALVLGDITPQQAEYVLEWTDSLLEKPLNLPVIMNEKCLWERLVSSYPDDTQAAQQRFSTLYHGSCSRIEAFCKVDLDMQDLKMMIESDLLHYSSLNQIGASRIVAQIIDELGLRVCLNLLDQIDHHRNDDEKFDFVALAERLVSKFINFEPEDKALIVRLHPSHESLMNIDETLSQILKGHCGYGVPEVLHAHVSTDELILLFQSVTPLDQHEELVSRIKASTENSYDFLQNLRKAQASSVEEPNGDASKPEVCDESTNNNITFDERIRREALRQLIIPLSPEGWGTIMGQLRNATNNLSVIGEVLEEQDRVKILDKLYYEIRRAGFAPLQNSWIHIDSKEIGIEDLRALCVLAMYTSDELHFNQLRRFIFDHPPLWPFLHSEHDGAGRQIESVTSDKRGTDNAYIFSSIA